MKVTGRVAHTEVGEWAGFAAGLLVIEMENGERREFRYEKRTEGPIPEVGNIVHLEYTGDKVLILDKIEIISDGTDDTTYGKIQTMAGHGELFSKPPWAVAVTALFCLGGIGLILFALLEEFHPNHTTEAMNVFLIAGGLFTVFGYLVWYYVDSY